MATSKKEVVETKPKEVKTVKVTANRVFFRDFTEEELVVLEGEVRKGSARKSAYTVDGMACRVTEGEVVSLDVEVAKKLQANGVVDIVL